jgi:hypothetical protein
MESCQKAAMKPCIPAVASEGEAPHLTMAE